MKIWIWTALVFLLVLSLIVFLKIPWWIMLVFGMPVLLYVLVYASFRYGTRPGLKPQDIPEKGYERRVRDLESAGEKLAGLDFERKDAFYLKMIPDAVVYVFRHKFVPIHFCVYHLGSKMTCDLVSKFERDITITTTPSADGGMLPRRPEALLQVVVTDRYPELFNAHMKAHVYVRDQGLGEVEIPEGMFRSYFMQSIREQAEMVRKMPLWPLRMVYWVVTKRGRIYQKPIAEQHREGTITVL
jgi:hypothetical protein